MTGSAKIRKWIRPNAAGYAFIAPSLLCFLVFLAYPAVESVRISFYKVTSKASIFVGLDNFRTIFHDEHFMQALVNTLKYVVYIVPACLILSILISVLIQGKQERVTAWYRGIFYLPAVASVVAVSLVWGWIFNPVIGIANYVLSLFGGEPVNWLSEPSAAFLCVVFVIVTWSVGQPIIIYTAALGGIPAHYYEAAEIDGANKFRQFISITWPLIQPATLYIVVITTIHAFQTFAVINLLTKGGPDGATSSVIYELYQTAFLYADFGTASAMGTILFVIIGVVSYFQFRFMTAKVEY